MDFRKIDKDQARRCAGDGVPIYVQLMKGMRMPIQIRTSESLREHPEDLDKYDPKIWNFFVED